MSRRLLGAELTLTLALVSGCGGHVNLGGKRSPGPDAVGDGGASNVAAVPNAARSTTVAQLAESFSAGTLAVAGDYLYFSGFDSKQVGGLYRCKKRNCDATRERLPHVSGNIASLAVFGQRLGVANLDGSACWLGSYALPNASDRQIAIGDLFPSQATTPLFQGSFVYFTVDLEYGVYRCPLPDCHNAPTRIGRTLSLSWIGLRAEAGVVFWTDGSFIYRAGANGDAPQQTLLPDATLSEAPPDMLSVDAPASDRVVSIAVGDGWLYAAVAHSETGQACDSSCPHRLQRWPSGGGPREVLLDTQGAIAETFVFGGELAWRGEDPGIRDGGLLSTCRVEACDATRRHVGQVRSAFKALVADDDDLYWLEAEPATDKEHNFPGTLLDRQIRRAPRLPPP